MFLTCDFWNDKGAVVYQAIAMFICAGGLGHLQQWIYLLAFANLPAYLFSIPLCLSCTTKHVTSIVADE
jgi:hypothetical protein